MKWLAISLALVAAVAVTWVVLNRKPESQAGSTNNNALITMRSTLSPEPAPLQAEIGISSEIRSLRENCGEDIARIVYGGETSCPLNQEILMVLEEFDVEPYRPVHKTDCSNLHERVPGTSTHVESSGCAYEKMPTSYSVEDTPSLALAARQDPLAALEMSRRVPPGPNRKSRSLGWLIHAVAIAPDPKKASGLLVRAALMHRPGRNPDGSLDISDFIDRLTFEEMAADRGNPFVDPQRWWAILRSELTPPDIADIGAAVKQNKERLTKEITTIQQREGFGSAWPSPWSLSSAFLFPPPACAKSARCNSWAGRFPAARRPAQTRGIFGHSKHT